MTGGGAAGMTPPARYPFFTPAQDARARELAAGIDAPLRLEHRHRWSPEEEYWGEPDEPIDPAVQEIIAAGSRDAWELEQVVPVRDWETSDDPILAAVELAARAERGRARGLLEGLLAEDVRCLDAHAHLGSFAYDYSAALALPHFETGVAIGERSLPAGFGGLLPWGWIDNRPFLRCLHGYALCLWRLGRFAAAEAVLDALLWLNPSDNQGARMLIEPVRAGIGWEPATRDPDDWRARGAGRRALLDRAAAVLDAPPRTLSADAAQAGFEPLLWLLDRARDGLPLTQTGAIGRQIVREAAIRFPDWWNSEPFGPPHREAELALLEALHAISRRAGLLRRRGRRLLLTARGRAALAGPEALLEAVAPHLVVGDAFEREVTELASAAHLAEPGLDRDALSATVHAAVAGWRTEDGPVSQRDVEFALTPFLHAAIGLGAVSDRPDRRRLTLSDAGAELLARALRYQATASKSSRRSP